MLMMARREGETILIGDDIEIHIAHIGRSRVKLGIRAPRNLQVVAREMELVSAQNRAAACSDDPSAAALAARTFSSTMAAERRARPTGSTSANSSPPTRATVSIARMQRRVRRATALSTASPPR